MSDALLMIFAKNPEAGKAKTRLAQEVGQDKALAIYHRLLSHTRDISRGVQAEVMVYFTPDLPVANPWEGIPHKAAVQPSGNLGERMATAFQENTRHYKRVIIIGSDNPALSSDHINTAFDYLKDADVVIGPAQDGGYYLLGMQTFQPALFHDIAWSTPQVLEQTLSVIQKLALSYATLPVQNDVDTYADWRATGWEP